MTHWVVGDEHLKQNVNNVHVAISDEVVAIYKRIPFG